MNVCILQMLYFDAIDVSERTGINHKMEKQNGCIF